MASPSSSSCRTTVYTRTIENADGSSQEMSVSIEAQQSRDCFSIDQPNTGHAVWFAADNLSNMIQDKRFSNEFDTASRILELGAGPGLVGIWAAKLLRRQRRRGHHHHHHHPDSSSSCCCCFVLTDGDEQVVELLRRNCVRNQLLDDDSDSDDDSDDTAVTCQPLEWGKEQAETLLESHPEGFDVILGADLIYGKANSTKMVSDLMVTAYTLMADNENAVFFLGFTRRNLPIEVALEIANRQGFVWTMEEDYTYDIFENNTDGQTCFWRDAIYSLRKGDGAAQLERTQAETEQ